MTEFTRAEIRERINIREKMLGMRHKDKMTYQAIGDRFGVTKQRVFQIVNNQYYFKKARASSFPDKIKIIFDGQEKRLLTRY